MSEQQDFADSYNSALRTERELWAGMRGRNPGEPGFNKWLWDRWLAAVERCTAYSRAMRHPISGRPAKEQKPPRARSGQGAASVIPYMKADQNSRFTEPWSVLGPFDDDQEMSG